MKRFWWLLLVPLVMLNLVLAVWGAEGPWGCSRISLGYENNP